MLGPHLILDLYECDEKTLSDPEKIYELLEKLPEIIGMRKIDVPRVYKIPPNPRTFDKGGITGYVPIQESHIAIHTFRGERFVSLDIFSCRQFDPNTVLDYIKKVFKPNKIDSRLIMRGERFTKNEVL